MKKLLTVLVALVVALCLVGTATPARTGGYGGIGSKVSAFYAQNTQGAGVPPLGLAFYTVDATRAGRVTAFHVVINAQPRFGTQELIALAGGYIELPHDANPVYSGKGGCVVYRSRTLGKLVGLQYAAVTASRDAQTGWVRASSSSRC